MTDHFALVDEEIVEVVRDQAGEVQFAGDNGVVDTLQDEADDNTPPPESKISPIRREVMTLQSNLIAKVSVDAAVLCLRKQGNRHLFFVRVMSRLQGRISHRFPGFRKPLQKKKKKKKIARRRAPRPAPARILLPWP